MNKFLIIFFCSFLAACVRELSPEELAQRQLAEQQAQRELAISFAQNCDPEIASLMRQRPSNGLAPMGLNTGLPSLDPWQSGIIVQGQDWDEAQYQEKISNPIFQNCYSMARDNYLTRQRLLATERRLAHYRYYEDDFWFPRFAFYYGVGFHHHRHHRRPYHRSHRPPHHGAHRQAHHGAHRPPPPKP